MLYSPIEHLAKIVALSRLEWKRVCFGMFTTAFDAAGSQHDQDFVVVAGFIASADSWIEFDKAWRRRLAEDDLTFFHAVDLAHSQEEFKTGWRDNEPRRQKLQSDLMEIICTHASRRFACAVDNRVFYENLSDEQREQYFLNAYSLAAMTCVADVMRWCKQERSPQFSQIRFVFEDGDEGRGDLITRFHIDLGMTPNFEFKKDTEMSWGIRLAFTPLQAADWLGYEILQGCKQIKHRTRDPRWGLEEFVKMPGTLGEITADTLEATVLNHEVAITTLGWFQKMYGKKV